MKWPEAATEAAGVAGPFHRQSPCSFAATTTTWEMNGYQDFLRGRLNGLSLTRDGRLVLGPKIETVFSSDQPEIWSVAQGSDGSLYLGTGHRGRLYKIDPSGKSTLLWTADQSEIFAVAIDAKGALYAATSPDGKVYRIENGKAAEYFAPAARYIWALQPAPDGALFVATGDQGKIFRVTSAGHGDIYYETGQAERLSVSPWIMKGACSRAARAERHPLPNHRAESGVRAVRRESAGDPGHCSGSRRRDLRGRPGRQRGAAYRRGAERQRHFRTRCRGACHQHHGYGYAERPESGARASEACRNASARHSP